MIVLWLRYVMSGDDLAGVFIAFIIHPGIQEHRGFLRGGVQLHVVMMEVRGLGLICPESHSGHPTLNLRHNNNNSKQTVMVVQQLLLNNVDVHGVHLSPFDRNLIAHRPYGNILLVQNTA